MRVLPNMPVSVRSRWQWRTPITNGAASSSLGLRRPQLALANVALAMLRFAEPTLFGKVIDQPTRLLTTATLPRWSVVGPWLAAWAAFGVFTIVAGMTVALAR